MVSRTSRLLAQGRKLRNLKERYALRTIAIPRFCREGVGWFRSVHYRNKKTIMCDREYIDRREIRATGKKEKVAKRIVDE